MKTMKTTILIILMSIGIQSFSQATFSKRKYRKGMFIERITRLKQKKATEIISPRDTSLVCKTIHEEKKVSGNAYIPMKHDTLAVADSHEDVVTMPLAKHTSKGYESIIKHNTLKLSAADIYCLNSRQFNVNIHQQSLEQELKTSSVVMQQQSDQSMRGNFFEELFEDLKRVLLICLLVMMAFALFASILGMATYPVASGPWIFGLALCIYATMGIVVAIAALTGRNGGKFMRVLEFVFLIISVGLLFIASAG